MSDNAGFADVTFNERGVASANVDESTTHVANPPGLVLEAHIRDQHPRAVVRQHLLGQYHPQVWVNQLATPLGAEGLHQPAQADAERGDLGLLVADPERIGAVDVQR